MAMRISGRTFATFKEELMKKLVFLGVLCSWAILVMAGDEINPLNVKLGLWQMSSTGTLTGRPPIPPDMLAKMTPEQRAKFDEAMKKIAAGAAKNNVHKSCLTKEKMEKDQSPFLMENKASCKRTILKSTESRWESREVCEERGVKTEANLQIEVIDSEHVRGTLHATSAGNANSMNVKTELTGKWLGTSCGDVK
jgi:hypothetical protein